MRYRDQCYLRGSASSCFLLHWSLSFDRYDIVRSKAPKIIPCLHSHLSSLIRFAAQHLKDGLVSNCDLIAVASRKLRERAFAATDYAVRHLLIELSLQIQIRSYDNDRCQ